MFIAIIGTRSAGKDTLKNYLVATKGFTCLGFNQRVRLCLTMVSVDADRIYRIAQGRSTTMTQYDRVKTAETIPIISHCLLVATSPGRSS